MAFTTVTAWAVGQRLKAAALNLMVTAIQELQTEVTKPIYESTRTGLTQSSGTAGGYAGSWGTSNGYTSSGAGVTVPKTGTYLCQQYVLKSAGSWNTRAFHDIVANSVVCGRAGVDTGVAETAASVFAVTQVLTAGQLIYPQYYQNSGSNCTVDVTFRAVFLGAN